MGSSSEWSYPIYPSHIDHIIISNELFDNFEQNLLNIKTLKLDDDFEGGWSEYNEIISDHRPIGIRIQSIN